MRRSTLLVGAGLVVVAAVIVVGLIAQDDRSAPPEVALDPVAEREPAPDFSVPTLGGDGDVALGDHRGRPLLVNFWASWCGPCRSEMPALERFAARAGGMDVVGLGVDDAPARLRAFAQETGVTFPLGIAPGRVARDYRATSLPVTAIVDAEGRLAATWYGEIHCPELEQVAAALDVAVEGSCET
jgi:thiol-disulfide isomerase/thioredoxin